MAKAKRFSMEQILAAQKTLRNLPPKNIGKTRAEAVECLSGSIRKAVEKGHTLQEIRDILVDGGVQLSLARIAAVLENFGVKNSGKETPEIPQGVTAGTGNAINGVSESSDSALKNTGSPEQTGTVPQQPLRLEKDGERIYVVGDTHEHKERIKAVGSGRWEPEKTAWSFPASSTEMLRETLRDLLE